MTNSQLYETIFKRRSIRKYDMKSLSPDTLSMVKQFTGTVKPLDSSIKYELKYSTTDEVRNLLPVKAPHYICLYSEKKDNYLMNAGFVLQQIDLFLSANNLASCWLGIAKPVKQISEEQNGLEFVIMLAFGNSSENIHRKTNSEFNRRKMAEITDIKGADELLEPVRLAPSASNKQPWFFSGSPDRIIVSRVKRNLLSAPLYGRMNQIDVGIALCHLWLSLDHRGKLAAFDYRHTTVPDGYEFMVQVTV